VQRSGTDKSDTVVKQLEASKFNDSFAHNATIRAQDHLLLHDVSLAQVKPSSEVKEPWDYEKVLKTIPATRRSSPPTHLQARGRACCNRPSTGW